MNNNGYDILHSTYRWATRTRRKVWLCEGERVTCTFWDVLVGWRERLEENVHCTDKDSHLDSVNISLNFFIFPFSCFSLNISQISNILLVGSKTLQYKVSYQVPYVLYHLCRIPWTMCNYMLFEWKCECWFWSFWIMGNRQNIQETSSSMNQSSTIYSKYNEKCIKERAVEISIYIEDGQKYE